MTKFSILDKNFLFLTKLSIFDKNWFLTKISTLDKISDCWHNFLYLTKNFYFWQNFRFLMKISINPDFGQPFWFVTKISINPDFWQKFWFATKIAFFDKNFDFWWNFQFLSKNVIFRQNFRFRFIVKLHSSPLIPLFWTPTSFLLKKLPIPGLWPSNPASLPACLISVLSTFL